MSAEATRRAALARYYDLDLVEEPGDVDMYLALADTTDEPILELAAGSGRLAVPLAAAGHEVWAVDLDPHMLARAEKRWAAAAHDRGGELHLVEGDLTSVALERRFGLVVLGLNSLLVLDGRQAQRAALETMARHVASDGRAVIDIWLPAAEDLALYDARLVLDWVRRDTETGRWVAKSTSARYSSAAATADISSFFDTWRDGEATTRVLRTDTISLIGAQELVALATAAGLVTDTLAGDYEMGQFGPDSERLVLVCGGASD